MSVDELAAIFDPLPFMRHELIKPDGPHWTRRRAQARTYAERVLAVCDVRLSIHSRQEES